MKYRGILGMLLSLIACGTNDPPNGGTGGSAGQVGTTGGSSTTGGVATGAGGTSTTNGGSTTTSGGTTSTAGTSQGQGGSAKGGATSANGGSPAAGSGSGGSPTAGQGGAPPAGGSGGTGGGGTTGPASVLERNGSPGREGTWTQPTLTKAAAAKMALEKGFAATFKGNMYASPLYTEKGPGGKGVFIAVSADNVVAALDETTGATVWSKTLGAGASQGCGFGSDPVGILGTPVIDEKSGTIYVAAAIGTGGGGKGVSKHEIHALSLTDGASKTGWPVNVDGMKSGSATFASQYQNQRSALSLVNGTVYVGYGGFVGDCNDYRGWIVAVDAADPSKTGAWATAGSKGDAIWAAGGFASDGTSIFPVTGNNTARAAARSATDSEAVLRINGLAKFERNDMNQFYPAAWKSMDDADADLGGSNTTMISIPGSTPEKVLAILGKDGKLFLLNPANLGGSEGQVAVVEAASVSSLAQGVKTVPTAYTTAQGTYFALSLASGAICPSGMQTQGATVMGIKLTGGATPKGTVAWCAQQQGTNTAPISTTSDGKADPIVWYVSNNQLRGVDGDTGATVFMGGDNCTGVNRWTSPIAVKGRIIAGANGKLCSWKPQ